MTTTLRETVRALAESMQSTIDALMDLDDPELLEQSSHPCAQGKDVWTLITNDIDHEKIHVGQVVEGRYEARMTPSHLQRLLGEWLVERSRLMAALLGLTDAQLNSETAPAGWSYRAVAEHVLRIEQDSLRSIREAKATRDGAAQKVTASTPVGPDSAELQ